MPTDHSQLLLIREGRKLKVGLGEREDVGPGGGERISSLARGVQGLRLQRPSEAIVSTGRKPEKADLSPGSDRLTLPKDRLRSHLSNMFLDCKVLFH